MKCSGCGKGLVGEETFCPNCGMKIDQLHHQGASIEVLAPSSLDISVSVNRNKRWHMLAALLASVAVLLAGWASHRANVKAVKEYFWKQGGVNSSKLLSVYSDLNAVGLSDQPGYSAALGKYDAKRSGKALLSEEQQDYETVRSRLFFGFLPSDIKKCVDVLHAEKVKEIGRVLGLAEKSFIRNTELEAGLDATERNSLTWSECNTVYIEIYETRASPKEVAEVPAATDKSANRQVLDALGASTSSERNRETDSNASPPIMARYIALHQKKAPDWSADDLEESIQLLLSAQGSDLSWVQNIAEQVKNQQCLASHPECLLQKREFAAWEKVKSGATKSARDALAQ